MQLTDAGVPTLKGEHWWRTISKILPLPGQMGIKFVAKVDDDSYVNLKELVHDMRRLHCVESLYYGQMSFTGYNPVN